MEMEEVWVENISDDDTVSDFCVGEVNREFMMVQWRNEDFCNVLRSRSMKNDRQSQDMNERCLERPHEVCLLLYIDFKDFKRRVRQRIGLKGTKKDLWDRNSV